MHHSKTLCLQEDITLMIKYDEPLRGVSQLQAIKAESDPSIPSSCFPFYATEVGKDTKNDDVYRFINDLLQCVKSKKFMTHGIHHLPFHKTIYIFYEELSNLFSFTKHHHMHLHAIEQQIILMVRTTICPIILAIKQVLNVYIDI